MKNKGAIRLFAILLAVVCLIQLSFTLITYLTEQSDDDNGMFIRIQSWDENKKHKEFKTFMGRKVKITIETID